MKTIIILFGEMGGGKNYHGETFAKFIPNSAFFDGDTVVPPEMADRVLRFKPLTREMIERYIKILTAAIEQKAQEVRHLVVAQALYFDEDRKQIKDYLEGLGYYVQFFWVRPPWWRNAWQILGRPRGFRWLLYWFLNKPYFQKPTHDYVLIR